MVITRCASFIQKTARRSLTCGMFTSGTVVRFGVRSGGKKTLLRPQDQDVRLGNPLLAESTWTNKNPGCFPTRVDMLSGGAHSALVRSALLTVGWKDDRR